LHSLSKKAPFACSFNWAAGAVKPEKNQKIALQVKNEILAWLLFTLFVPLHDQKKKG